MLEFIENQLQEGDAVPEFAHMLSYQQYRQRCRAQEWATRRYYYHIGTKARLYSGNHSDYRYGADWSQHAVIFSRTDGRANAIELACARKEGPASEVWLDLYARREWGDYVPYAVIKHTPAGTLRAISNVRGKFPGEWRAPIWEELSVFTSQFQNNHDKYRRHFCHTSTTDPACVAYYPSLAYLLAGREIKIKPGKYLTKYFSSIFTEQQIRGFANQQIAHATPTPLNFVENDDPDGWEWVYEHGSGFTSCMVYKRSGRYLDYHLHGENHPVRVYARQGNGLRLAWLGDSDAYKTASDEGAVTSRSVVRDNEDGTPRGYVRIYGDDSRMREALRAAGYGQQTDLYGVELNRRDGPERGVICPYLDSGYVELHDTYMEITRGGTSTQASGLIADENDEDYFTCDDCNERTHNDDMCSIGYDGDGCVCQHCADAHYQYVRGRRGCEYYISCSEAVECDGEWYDPDYISYYNLTACEDCGELVHEANVCATRDGYYCENCVTALDIEDDEGNSYASTSNTMETESGETIHEDDAVTDAVLGTTYHREQMFAVTTNNKRSYIHPTTLEECPDLFRMFGCPAFGYVLTFGAGVVGDSLRDYDFAAIYRIQNVSEGALVSLDFGSVLQDIYDAAHPEPLRLAA